MKKIANQDYDYNSIKNALNSVKDNVNENLSAMGENPNSGLFDSIKGWFIRYLNMEMSLWDMEIRGNMEIRGCILKEH